MPSAPDSFADGIYKLAQQLASMELAPDADTAFIQQARDLLLSYVKGGQQPAGGITGAAGLLESMGQGQPVPVVEGEMSRAPRSNPDMTGAVSELERVMAGS